MEADGGRISSGAVVGVDQGVGIGFVWDSVGIVVVVQDNIVDLTYDNNIILLL